jgi:hypothetical protein
VKTNVGADGNTLSEENSESMRRGKKFNGGVQEGYYTKSTKWRDMHPCRVCHMEGGIRTLDESFRIL